MKSTHPRCDLPSEKNQLLLTVCTMRREKECWGTYARLVLGVAEARILLHQEVLRLVGGHLLAVTFPEGKRNKQKKKEGEEGIFFSFATVPTGEMSSTAQSASTAASTSSSSSSLSSSSSSTSAATNEVKDEEKKAQHTCAGADCGKPATMQCPTCIKNHWPTVFYCDQECFKKNWDAHLEKIHKSMSPLLRCVAVRGLRQ